MPYHVGKPNEMLLYCFGVSHEKKVSVYPRRVRLIFEERGRQALIFWYLRSLQINHSLSGTRVCLD